MPVFGKILNTEKETIDKVISNIKILEIVKALGCGIGESFDISKLKYHKIIIFTDADVDGEHIRTLYLTLFFRFFKELIDGGFIYIAVPPLYKVSKGKKFKYLYTNQELNNTDTTGCKIQRYKGLGEMNGDQLWETTMNPENRRLIKVTAEDYEDANYWLSILMGDNSEEKKTFIQEGMGDNE